MAALSSASDWHLKKTLQVQDDDQSTAVPSEALDGTVSDLSTWDTGNLEELGSCGVLSSAEMRAARLQKIARASGAGNSARAAGARPKQAPASSSVAKARPKAKVAPSVVAKPAPSTDCTTGQVDDDCRSTAATSTWSSNLDEVDSSCGLSAAELRNARLQSIAKASSSSQQGQCPKASSAVARPKSASTSRTAPKAKAKPVREQAQAGTELKCSLDAQSREAIREMGLWEYMPARNPVVTRNSAMGADWNLSFEEYQHTLGGQAEPKPVQRPHAADELNRRLDVQSREAIKEMGLWEHMPARNPVVTRQSPMGADWHVGFEEYVHTLGGVPDPKPAQRPHHADELQRHLDKSSRETIKQMGLWEHTPAKNPVVTGTSSMGASWNMAFK